jgi:hypothetical protein
MFIEPVLTTTRAPAERNVSGARSDVEQVSLPSSEEEPFEVARSINISSLRDEKAFGQLSHFVR